MRLRVGGTDNSTANSYTRQRLLQTGASVAGDTNTGSFWQSVAGLLATSQGTITTMTITRPAEATITNIITHAGRDDSQAMNSGMHNQTVAYDGFSLIASAGTITGNVRVYGYRDS
jgi:hypothetical protein